MSNPKILDTFLKKGKLTYNTQYFDTADFNDYFVQGRFCFISFRAKIKQEIPNQAVILTLPFKPAAGIELPIDLGYQYTIDSQRFAYLTGSTKNVYIATTGEVNKYVHIRYVYPISEEEE